MTTRRLFSWCASAVLLVAVAGLLWKGSAGPTGQDARPDPAASEPKETSSQRQAPETVPTQAAREAVERPPQSADELGARLRRAAEIELAVMRSGSIEPEAQAELQGLLEPSLSRREELPEILGHLVARAWVEGDGARPSTTEFGAIRFLYWGLLLRHAPGNPYADARAGEELFVAVVTALPRMSEALRTTLLDQVLEIQIDGRSLVGLHLTRVLELRASLAEHKPILSALLAVLEHELSLAEKDALFGLLLVDESDPVLVATSLKNLLQGTRPDLAMALAAELFDAPDSSFELRSAIARAVVHGAEDPYEAVEFLAQRTVALRNEVGTWMWLGMREGGSLALEARYRELLERGADPLTRKMLLMGIDDSDEALVGRVREMALDDPDPTVRGQAWRTWTGSRRAGFARIDLVDLWTARDEGVPAADLAVSVHWIARWTDGDLRRDAIAFLRSIAMDEGVTLHDRRQALEDLRAWLSATELQVVQDAIQASAAKD